MLDTNESTGAQVVPLPNMSRTETKQHKTIIELTARQLDQWVPKLTMEIYLQYQQKNKVKY